MNIMKKTFPEKITAVAFRDNFIYAVLENNSLEEMHVNTIHRKIITFKTHYLPSNGSPAPGSINKIDIFSNGTPIAYSKQGHFYALDTSKASSAAENINGNISTFHFDTEVVDLIHVPSHKGLTAILVGPSSDLKLVSFYKQVEIVGHFEHETKVTSVSLTKRNDSESILACGTSDGKTVIWRIWTDVLVEVQKAKSNEEIFGHHNDDIPVIELKASHSAPAVSPTSVSIEKIAELECFASPIEQLFLSQDLSRHFFMCATYLMNLVWVLVTPPTVWLR